MQGAPVNEQRDEQLMSDHLAGKPGAFDLLAKRYASDLYGFLLKFVGSATAAEDLVQESFLQVISSAAAYDPSRPFKPWLYTVAANKARDFLRSRGRRPEYSLDTPGSDPDSPSAADSLRADEVAAGVELDADEERSRVRALIAKMPEHLRLMLVLGYYQQLPYAEIAEIVGIPVGTVKSRLHAAVTQFSKLWKEQGRASRRDSRE